MSTVSRATRDRFLAVLVDDGPMTSNQLAELSGSPIETVRAALGLLYDDDEVHVHDFQPPARGKGIWLRVYAAGPGPDAPVPAGARIVRLPKIRATSNEPPPAPAPPPAQAQQDLLVTLKQRAAAGAPVPAWLANLPAAIQPDPAPQ